MTLMPSSAWSPPTTHSPMIQAVSGTVPAIDGRRTQDARADHVADGDGDAEGDAQNAQQMPAVVRLEIAVTGMPPCRFVQRPECHGRCAEATAFDAQSNAQITL